MIKRGTAVVWHRPPFDSLTTRKYRSGVVMRSDSGKALVVREHHEAEDYWGKCLSIVQEEYQTSDGFLMRGQALFLEEGHSTAIRVPLDELEERQ